MNPTSPEFASLWEIAKGVMMSLTTLGVGWIARMVFSMRDDVRDLNYDVRGRDGKNGIKAKLTEVVERLEVLEDRNIALDAVAAIEKQEYEGDERRHGLRTIRDMIRAEIAVALVHPHPEPQKEP